MVPKLATLGRVAWVVGVVRCEVEVRVVTSATTSRAKTFSTHVLAPILKIIRNLVAVVWISNVTDYIQVVF